MLFFEVEVMGWWWNRVEADCLGRLALRDSRLRNACERVKEEWGKSEKEIYLYIRNI